MREKRQIDNIYYKNLTMEHLEEMYNTVRKTCKNRVAVFLFALNKNANLSSIYYKLYTKTYTPSKFSIFTIF